MPKNECKPIPPLSENDVQRFIAKVDRRDDPDECWLYSHNPDYYGYGRFYAQGRNMGAHRIAFIIYHGYDPFPLLVCHTCDVRRCCNPFHLFAGTTKDNSDDKISKGRGYRGDRHWLRLNPERVAGDKNISRRRPEVLARGDANGSRLHPERLKRGEECSQSKLTVEQVLEIRRLHASGIPYRRLAKTFHVCKSLVGYIVTRQAWSHI